MPSCKRGWSEARSKGVVVTEEELSHFGFQIKKRVKGAHKSFLQLGVHVRPPFITTRIPRYHIKFILLSRKMFCDWKCVCSVYGEL